MCNANGRFFTLIYTFYTSSIYHYVHFISIDISFYLQGGTKMLEKWVKYESLYLSIQRLLRDPQRLYDGYPVSSDDFKPIKAVRLA